MDTESFLFIYAVCFLSTAVTSLLPVRKVIICNCILSIRRKDAK